MAYKNGDVVSIRVVDNSFDEAYCDTTEGNVYSATFYKKGELDESDDICIHDTISFTDDARELVCGWLWRDIDSGVIELV